MAQSNAHKFGQIIGDILELAIQKPLAVFANEHHLFLDKKGVRKTRTGKKLTWIDLKNNKHDLDFVLEKDGTDELLGTPVAFIETAWRRYTKHSRNKAQEIQGALLPLAEKYHYSSPFLGVVLAGVFTEGAITQLESLGFTVLYLHYETILGAFNKFGINAAFQENTTEEEFDDKIRQWEELNNSSAIADAILEENVNAVNDFTTRLERSIIRQIDSVGIFSLYGVNSLSTSIYDAIEYLEKYDLKEPQDPKFVRFEIIIRYNTGDKIEASFKEKVDAIDFLKSYL